MSPIDFSITNFNTLKNVTCAQVLIEYLKVEGVKYVFGVSGGTIISILEALEEAEDINFIMSKHEGSASFMADMYARVSGRIGVCLSTAGPGATNMLTGVACAQQDRVPLLAITGQPATHTMGKGAVQESSEFGVDTVGIYGQFTGFSSLISEPEVLQQLLTRALRVAQGEHKQAVHLSIPTNVSSYKFNKIDIHSDAKKYRVSHAAIDFEQIKKAATLLVNAKRPAILVGPGISSEYHREDLIHIAEMLNCPVLTTPKGKGIFPESHPLSFGVFGFAGNLCAKKYLFEEEVDLLLVISSRLGEWTTDAWNPDLFPSKYLIQIDVDSQNIGQNFPVSLGIVGDVGAAVKELFISLLRIKNQIPITSLKHIVNGKRFESLIEYKRQTGIYQEPEKMHSDAVPLKPQRLMHDLNSCLEKDAIVIADAGNSYAWTLHYLVINPPQKYYIALGFASMGHATAGVVGAALAAPQKQVIAVVGDGAVLMNGNEIHTAVEYNIPAIWLVLNDSKWGMVYHGNRAVIGKSLSSQFHPVDFVAFAEVMGATGYRVTEPGQLCEIMPQIVREKKPAVIDAIIDAEEEPPFIERVRAVLKYMKKTV
ncbi:MAG: thiamine pyrophosphate-binding protein [Spirochaetales bacterium]|nr:thiamine pyrophosphate-binding protein [Spirochaetales bacterium]